MRLLNTHTFELEEFTERTPQYAILSHCWGEEEVTFDWMSNPSATNLAGFQKLQGCCNTARRYDFKYVWMDTCCIDKRSSAELSEAINSMYKWYAGAEVCFAYLADYFELGFSTFQGSRWFKRGWTLQELLAPRKVVFFDATWSEIGTRNILKNTIAGITGIDVRALQGYWKIQDEFSIAQKMSWAAMRETTRPEDLAYCLLGIFDINMPILYGEGNKAFQRLQLEIMKLSDDQSLFTWQDESNVDNEMIGLDPQPHLHEWATGLLAEYPAQFRDSGEVKYDRGLDASYTMTNLGLDIQLPLIPISADELHKHIGSNMYGMSKQYVFKNSECRLYQALLNCRLSERSGQLAIYLWTEDDDTFCRVFTSTVARVDSIAGITKDTSKALDKRAPSDEMIKPQAVTKTYRDIFKVDGQKAQMRRIYVRESLGRRKEVGVDAINGPRALVAIKILVPALCLLDYYPQHFWKDVGSSDDDIRIWFDPLNIETDFDEDIEFQWPPVGWALFKMHRTEFFAVVFRYDLETKGLSYDIIPSTKDYNPTYSKVSQGFLSAEFESRREEFTKSPLTLIRETSKKQRVAITCIPEGVEIWRVNLTVDQPIIPTWIPSTFGDTELCRFDIHMDYLSGVYSLWDVYANDSWGTHIPQGGISVKTSDRFAKAIIRLRCEDLSLPDDSREAVIHVGMDSNTPWCAIDLSKKFSVLDYRERLALPSKKWFSNRSTFSYQRHIMSIANVDDKMSLFVQLDAADGWNKRPCVIKMSIFVERTPGES
jgi:hypothetical protein